MLACISKLLVIPTPSSSAQALLFIKTFSEDSCDTSAADDNHSMVTASQDH